jgi:hypothetical protein
VSPRSLDHQDLLQRLTFLPGGSLERSVSPESRTSVEIPYIEEEPEFQRKFFALDDRKLLTVIEIEMDVAAEENREPSGSLELSPVSTLYTTPSPSSDFVLYGVDEEAGQEDLQEPQFSDHEDGEGLSFPP